MVEDEDAGRFYLTLEAVDVFKFAELAETDATCTFFFL